jgi:membrane protease YdiL (CAAX protease family)
MGPSKDRVLSYFVLACLTTWVLAVPTALAWSRHETPGAFAVACSGLSAFGPTLAALVVAGRAAFGPWRARPAWVVAALLAPIAVRVAGRALFVAAGGDLDAWLIPPATPEQVAALVVFPLGEEPGWRGFAQPRVIARYGPVRGPLLLGFVWGLWHLAYAFTPAGFAPLDFALAMLELPLYSLLIAWTLARARGSLTVAIAFHAGAHLDHIERAPALGLQVCHLAVLALLAGAAAISAHKRKSASH